MIATSHLSRRFGAKLVVDNVSLRVERAEIVALLGPNGAGKTTTLRMLAGLIAPTAGTVEIDGVPLNAASGSALRRRIGFLTESPGLWDRLTVRENLAIYGRLYPGAGPERAVDRLLERFDLVEHGEARAAELSKGTRQKVAIARAMLHEPEILLFDEPTSGLDPEMARTVRQMLDDRRSAGCAIVVSTHNLDEAERLADRVAVLQQSLVALDRPVALRQRMMPGRVTIRVRDDAARWIETARTFDPAVTADGRMLQARLDGDERRTPALIRALVLAGAEIVEVRPDAPALEDVYLHLVAEPHEAVRS